MNATPVTIQAARLIDDGHALPATHLRIADGRIAAIGGAEVQQPGDLLVARDGSLLPGLIDAHMHLLPGAGALAATFGVTTLIDQFSKPEVIDPEHAAICAAESGTGPARAGLRTSSIGATAPGGHPTMAYAPIPYVHGPQDAPQFVADRIAEGATHLKIIYDDGMGAALSIPTLGEETISALVEQAHGHGLPVVAHVSTAAGALTVVHCGVDALAHAPFDHMSHADVAAVAERGVAVIATLDVTDGFPDEQGRMPLLADAGLAPLLTPRWRRVLENQARRWMPPGAPDGAIARENVRRLHAAGVRILAGTDAPNPGLVFGASLHRELHLLVCAGLPPAEALVAATTAPAELFGLDRGRLRVGAPADLLLVDGDPTRDITATSTLVRIWCNGREMNAGHYPGGTDERETIAALKESNEKIVAAIKEAWPGIPGPEEVHTGEGELLGRVIPSAGGWTALTTFGGILAEAVSHAEAVDTLQCRGLSVLAQPWWVRLPGEEPWQEVRLMEVHAGRVRLRWADPLVEQPAAGQWFDTEDLDFAPAPPANATLGTGSGT